MVNDNTPTKQRLIIRFGKADALRYTSNLDLAKVWERVLRRAGLPLLYSKGFNTRPRLQLATALPLGITSDCELVDVSLKEIIPLDDTLVERLQAVSPQGLRIHAVEEENIYTPALQTLVRSAEYRFRFLDPIDRDAVQQRIDTLFSQSSILKVTERKNRKSVADLRPLIYEVRLSDEGDLLAHMAAGEQGNLRPDDLLAELSLNHLARTVHRLQLHLEKSR